MHLSNFHVLETFIQTVIYIGLCSAFLNSKLVYSNGTRGWKEKYAQAVYLLSCSYDLK